MDRREPHPMRRGDEGVTLIEVMVAMLVFAVISTGIVASMTTISRMTVDNRARVTAANLASQDIDLVRAIGDPTEIIAATSSTPASVTVDGRVYSVKRTVSWISNTGGDISCNTPTNPFYLRVNVRVTWNTMLTTTAPVQDDTIVAPAGRISDSSLGSIGVSVTGATNDPQSGVAVTVSSSTGGAGITTQPANTGPDGCTYANNVPPDTYSVKISKSGWIDSASQATTVTKTAAVTAGSTQSPSFPLYAQAATITTRYVSSPVAYGGSFSLPTNLETTWVNSGTTWTTAAPASSVTRFPFASGYGVIAGLTDSGTRHCDSADPQAWPDNASPLKPVTHPTVSATAGGTSSVDIPVGVVLVRAPAGYILSATQGGQFATFLPSCDITGSNYTWSTRTTGQFQAVALPYGTWRFKYGSTSIGASDLQVKSSVYPQYGVDSSGLVILDPRSS